MADKSSQMVLSALSRAVADPEGLPLHGSKSSPGLFPGTAGGKQAAQRCLEEGYLLPLDTGGKPRCVVTDKGLSYLLGQVSPRQVLEDFVRVLEARQAQLDSLLATARDTRAGFDTLKTNAEKVLQHVVRSEKPASLSALFGSFRKDTAPVNGTAANETTSSLEEVVVQHLTAWHDSGAAEDCPLPDLYRCCAKDRPGLSIGRFHDTLRQLHVAQRIYLHPWTGPLYDLPEPPFALLIGHEIAYYASVRSN